MVLKSNLSKIARLAPHLASEALIQTGADIADIAKQLVPVDTGALRQSIGSVPESSEKVIVGAGNGPVDYAAHVEYGTSRSAAQPFLTPAFAQAEETFKKRLAEKMKELENA